MLRPLRTAALLAALLLALPALPADEAAADDDYRLSPALEAAIVATGEVKKAGLPPMKEERMRIPRPTSTAPGRMVVRRTLIIDKPHCRGYLVDALGNRLLDVPVCASRNRGQKKSADDWRTPEGTFPLYGLYNSTDWTYKDTDDKCYGPWFLSLKTPRYWGVGVHGTNAPGSVPGRRSHGCIRMHNENIVRVKALVQKDIRVTVVADPEPTAD